MKKSLFIGFSILALSGCESDPEPQPVQDSGTDSVVVPDANPIDAPAADSANNDAANNDAANGDAANGDAANGDAAGDAADNG